MRARWYFSLVALTALGVVIDHPSLGAGAELRSRLLFSAAKHRATSGCLECGNIDVYTVRATGPEQQRLTRYRNVDAQPAWSPDHTKVAFVRYLVHTDVVDNNKSAIFVMNRDGSEKTRVTNGRKLDIDPTWSPSGTKIAFVRRDSGSIYVATPGSSESVRLTHGNNVRDDEPSWSPDGRYIVFTRDDGTTTTLWVMNADGSDQRQLTSQVGAQDSDPQWSSDGTAIVFVRSVGDTSSDIYIVPSGGGSAVPLTDDPRLEADPRWSPVDQTVLFTRLHGDDNRELYRIDADGTSERRLTRTAASDIYATWSPRGDQIAFIKVRAGAREIYIINSDASEKRRVTMNRLDEYSLQWSYVP